MARSGESWQSRFWRQWIAANGAAELVGLGTVAAMSLLVVKALGGPEGLRQSLMFAAVLVSLGAFEGYVVGWAQARVMRTRLPQLDGWVGATVVGAVVAWILGMTPSTIMSAYPPAGSAPPPEMRTELQLLLAAGLGLVAGPVLAFFQWRRLRHYVRRAGLWLPANAAAWALGMPVIFAGVHVGTTLANPVVIALYAALTLLTAGAVVGVVHGWVLLKLLGEQPAVSAP